MEERARIAGATLTIDSRPSDGTRVLVFVPVVAG
jgi:signal transduction histidine kinase